MPDEPWHVFYLPSAIEWGEGCASAVPARLSRIEATRPMIVTDPGVLNAGVVDGVVEGIRRAGLQAVVFDGVHPNPTDKNVYAGTVKYQDERCDSLVAVGGGSVIDAAKVIRMLVAHPHPLQELYADAGGVTRIRRAMPRLISIPTTAGTGAEISRGSLITDTSVGRKRLVLHPRLSSTISLLDPLMTIGLPPFQTKTSGADALAHCIEGFAATAYHPIADGIALEGIRLIWESLPKVVSSPRDVAARGKMLLAASMGALAIQKGVGAAHALAHPLSDVVGMPHGLANAIVLPTVMEFNSSVAPARYAAIARAIGVDPRGSDEETARAGIEAVRTFLTSLDIPTRLRDAEVSRSKLPELAAQAIQDDSHQTNPRSCTESDLRNLYEAAF